MANKIPLLAYVFDRRKTARPNKEGAVELRVTYEGQQKYMTTGVRLLPKHWHRGTVTNRPDALELNQILEKLVVDVRKVILSMLEEGHIDIFAIPTKMKRMNTGKVSFLEFCEQRTKIREYGKSPDSQARYERFINFLEDWGKIIEFEDVNESNIIAMDELLSRRGMKANSKWGNYHRFLNSFILDAIDEGYLQRNPYRWIRIDKDKSSGGLNKYLTPEEFAIIRDMEPPTESLTRIRDLFVFQTYTCLSYIDLEAFDAKKIQTVKNKKVYVGKRGKTNQTFTIPLLNPALDILKKYKNKLPIISNVKYNQYLKALAQHAGIDKPLSSHWARHTGATLLLNEGVAMGIVSKICGHSSTKMTEQVYAKLLDETVVDAVSQIEEKITE